MSWLTLSPSPWKQRLPRRGSATSRYYRTPIHLQESIARLGPGRATAGDRTRRTHHLAIPMSPVLSQEQAELVAETVRGALAR